MKTLIIAEAGVNHDGQIEKALQLVDAAADAGSDIVKFQTFRAELLATTNAPKAKYQEDAQSTESQFEMLKRLELSRENHFSLIERCKLRGIEFLSTAFELESLEFLKTLELKKYKVPSGEITNLPYLKRIGSYGKPIILSTGMCNLADIEAALSILEKAGTSRSLITLLHCNTEYPTPFDDVNLRAMLSLKRSFGAEVGYSDHTSGIEVAIGAVALGATVIEKHFTLDSNSSGPDHKASLEPEQFKQMVVAIRNIERSLGDGIKRPTPSETKNMIVARKSIVASKRIQTGEVFTEENLAVRRPGSGISPMRLYEVIGRKAPRSFDIDEIVEI